MSFISSSLILNIIFAFLIVVVLINRYANWRKQNVVVTFAVIISWYFSFLIIFILPLDITSTVYRQCTQNNATANETCVQPLNFVEGDTLPHLWRIIYWSTQFLTWFLLPLMQSYAKAGEFHFKLKLKCALYDNFIYYASFFALALLLLVYLMIKQLDVFNIQRLKAIASSASNTWGLFLLVLLLGYALVDIPRELWLSGKRRHLLNKAYFKLSKLSVDKSEAEETLHDILDSLQIVDQYIGVTDVLYQYLSTINQKIPGHVKQNMRRQQRVDEDIIPPSYKTLVNLHSQLIKALQTYGRTHTQWGMMVQQVILLEDIEKNQSNRERSFVHSFPLDHQTSFLVINPRIEWYWRCWIEPKLMLVLGVIAGLMSFAVLWSEVTFFNKSPVLSLFAILFNRSAMTYDYFTIECLTLLGIAYLCFCAYSTVFKIRLLNFVYLAPHQLTDEYSLIFAGMLLCRLTPPLCLNFLGMIHLDSHIIQNHALETYYTQVMGHMDVISIISDGFNIYFPMLMLLLCLATYFSVGSKLLSIVGFHQFLTDDEVTTDLIDEGKVLITREKRKRQRLEETQGRQREFQERFGTGAGTGSTANVRNVPSSRGGSDSSSRPYNSHSMKTNLLEAAAPIEGYHTTEDTSTEVRDPMRDPPRGIFDDI
uniref:LMBR1 domain-containing protein 2 homolog n=1 Tax=Cacopsylla melanoneura TaxID=428564 RepID=A0A8D8RSA0_9HEMI